MVVFYSWRLSVDKICDGSCVFDLHYYLNIYCIFGVPVFEGPRCPGGIQAQLPQARAPPAVAEAQGAGKAADLSMGENIQGDQVLLVGHSIKDLQK